MRRFWRASRPLPTRGGVAFNTRSGAALSGRMGGLWPGRGEQLRLRQHFMRVAEIAQPHAGEAVTRARRLAYAIAQRQRDPDELLLAGGRMRRREAAREDAEVAGLELQDDGAADAVGLFH